MARTTSIVVLSLLLGACSTPTGPPILTRTTTAAERATANKAIDTAEKAALVLRAAGKIDEATFARAQLAIAELKSIVAASEHAPIDVADLLLRAATLALQFKTQQNE